MGSLRHPSAWSRIPIAKIEDLSDAVLGAGLEATQMSSGDLSGSLAFSQFDGVVYSSGLINGRVGLYGPLSPDMITLGIGLDLAPGTRHWLNEVETGNIGIFYPGDVHDSIYCNGSLYATVTLTAERLEEEAAKSDVVLDRKTLGGTGVHHRNLAAETLLTLKSSVTQVHARQPDAGGAQIGRMMLDALIDHLARPPHLRNGGTSPNCHARLVARAREYIHENLGEPISVDDIAAAAYTSRRTLLRAFTEVLDDTPRSYVRRLRLHRIRHDLASDAERACSIALVANEWGISDIGRMAGRYRELFGELPSVTRSKY
jgi:AraC-like DNA-binding protein